ncbi:MAG: hypothetical protein H7Z43_12025, partial [Clostridia bacterium]|nr:hypothetical protein [Deltaproteobacteria bacterium]
MNVRADKLGDGFKRTQAGHEPEVKPLLETGPVMQSGNSEIFAPGTLVSAASGSVTSHNSNLEGSCIKVSGDGKDMLTFRRENDGTIAVVNGSWPGDQLKAGLTNWYRSFNSATVTKASLEVVSALRYWDMGRPIHSETRTSYTVSGDTLTRMETFEQTGRRWYFVGPFDRLIGTSTSESVYIRHDPKNTTFPELRDQQPKSSGDPVVDQLAA